MFPRTEENLTAQQGTKLVRRDVKARCFRMSSITCYAVGESGEGMEGGNGREGVNMLLGHSHQLPNFFQKTRPIYYV